MLLTANQPEFLSKREKEKTKTHTISSGKVIIHADKELVLNLTDAERNSYQETMDDFIEQQKLKKQANIFKELGLE